MNNKLYLALDTTAVEENWVAIFNKDEKLDQVLQKKSRIKRVTPLRAVDSLLIRNNLTLEKLSGLFVVQSGGSFSALRSGISLALSVSFAVDLPVAGMQKRPGVGISKYIGKLSKKTKIQAQYKAEPNISKPKSRPRL